MKLGRITSGDLASHWVGLVVSALALGGLASCDVSREGPTLHGVRRGAIHILVDEPAEVWVDVRMAPGHENYAYVIGPDGRTSVRKHLGHPYRGTFNETVSEPGVHTLLVSPSHRTHVTVVGAPFVLEPQREFPSLFLSGKHRYAFEVAKNARRFTLAATNQFDWGGSAGAVRLYDPMGALVHKFTFEDLDQAKILAKLGVTEEQLAHYQAQGDTAVVAEFKLLIDRHEVRNPMPGTWEVEAEIFQMRPDDIGFWLEGIPNYFMPVGGEFFIPEREPTAASVRVSAGDVLGPTGDVGTVWGFTLERERTLGIFEELGLTASKHFYPQVDMEPRNDDLNPSRINWDGFNFKHFTDRLDYYRDQPIPLTALMTISRIAPWAVEVLPEIAEYAEATVRYHQVTLGLDPDGLYWQFLNEPNHYASLDDYMKAYDALAWRIAWRLETDNVPVKLGGPGTGNASDDRGTVAWPWVERLIAEQDSVVDFVVWNQYRLWRIEDTWRYRQHIERADSLIRVLDTDGQREEILIGATNLRGGIVLENERQDGWYSAIWWPSVLCQTLGTGRCRMVNYFFLIDQGARRKGLLFEDWSEKPVARATAFFNRYRGDRVLRAETDHDGVDILATWTDRVGDSGAGPVGRSPNLTGPGLSIVLVNKTEHSVRLTVDVDGLPQPERWTVDRENHEAGGPPEYDGVIWRETYATVKNGTLRIGDTSDGRKPHSMPPHGMIALRIHAPDDVMRTHGSTLPPHEDLSSPPVFKPRTIR